MATQLEVANKLGISDRWLRKLVEAGAVKDRSRGAWDALDVAVELLAHEKSEIARLNGEIARLNGALQRSEGSGAVKSDEDARRAKAMADKAEMEVAEMRGELVPADDVADALGAMVQIMKTRLLAVPVKAATRVGAKEVAFAERSIREEVVEALSELSVIKVTGRAA